MPVTPAETLARRAHAGQLDKAGQPYVKHLERVVGHLLRRWPDAREDEVAAAWLHDVIEDCGWSFRQLDDCGISVAVIGIINQVTRPPGLHYAVWIENLLCLHGSVSAIRVKLADLADNTDPARVAAIPDGPGLLERRYRPAMRMLEARLARELG